MMSIEDVKIILQNIQLGLCRTEREGINDAIYYLELLEDYLEDNKDE